MHLRRLRFLASFLAGFGGATAVAVAQTHPKMLNFGGVIWGWRRA